MDIKDINKEIARIEAKTGKFVGNCEITKGAYPDRKEC